MSVSAKSRVVSNVTDGVAHCRSLGFPVQIKAQFVLGGWEKTATNEEEVRTMLNEGLRLSPVERVDMIWVR